MSKSIHFQSELTIMYLQNVCLNPSTLLLANICFRYETNTILMWFIIIESAVVHPYGRRVRFRPDGRTDELHYTRQCLDS